MAVIVRPCQRFAVADVLIRFRRLAAGVDAAAPTGSAPGREDERLPRTGALSRAERNAPDSFGPGVSSAAASGSFDDLGVLRLRRKVLTPRVQRGLSGPDR
jgi:hypothetical protein